MTGRDQVPYPSPNVNLSVVSARRPRTTNRLRLWERWFVPAPQKAEGSLAELLMQHVLTHIKNDKMSLTLEKSIGGRPRLWVFRLSGRCAKPLISFQSDNASWFYDSRSAWATAIWLWTSGVSSKMIFGEIEKLSLEIRAANPVLGNSDAGGEAIKTQNDVLLSLEELLILEKNPKYLCRLDLVPAAVEVARAAFLFSKICGLKVSRHGE